MPGRTGRGLRIGVIDTGVHPNHPHIAGIERSVAFDQSGAQYDDAVDRVGHGTAVAAAIHEKAPEAALLAVRIFDRGLVTTGAALRAAIRWSIDAGVDLINLSLGMDSETPGLKTRGSINELIADATARQIVIVAAAPTAEHEWLPGALAGVIGVELDWTCARDECVAYRSADGAIRVRASGFPRPIPGVDPEKNVKGQSFAVANVTGLLALACEGSEDRDLLGG